MAWRYLVRLGDQGFGELRTGKSRLALWSGELWSCGAMRGRVEVRQATLRFGVASCVPAFHGRACTLVRFGSAGYAPVLWGFARRGRV